MHNDFAIEATKNISGAKSEDPVDNSTITKWFKKFRSGCKNFDDQARSGRPKRVDFEAMLPAIEANPVISSQASSASNSPVLFVIFPTPAKNIRKYWIKSHITKFLQTFVSFLNLPLS